MNRYEIESTIQMRNHETTGGSRSFLAQLRRAESLEEVEAVAEDICRVHGEGGLDEHFIDTRVRVRSGKPTLAALLAKAEQRFDELDA